MFIDRIKQPVIYIHTNEQQDSYVSCGLSCECTLCTVCLFTLWDMVVAKIYRLQTTTWVFFNVYLGFDF